MKLHYFLSCTLATGSLVIFRELRTPRVSEIRGAHTIRVTEFTYDASVVSVESFLIEKWRSMGFAMPIDGQTFTWDQYLETGQQYCAGCWRFGGFFREDSDNIAGIITYVDAPKATLLVYVPVAPGVGQ